MDRELFLTTMEISFEISECDLPLERIIEIVEKQYPGWTFDRTEARYQSCVMAIFERRTA